MIGLVAAFKTELRGVLEDLSPLRTARVGESTFFVGGLGGEEVVAGVSGLGLRRAGEAAAELIRQFRPSLLISTGTCGAIAESLHTGHIVVPEAVQSLSLTAEDPLPEPSIRVSPQIQESLVLARSRAGISGQAGLLLTADRVVRTAAEKKALGDIPGAVAVDMESVAVAEAAQRAEVPFGIVRAVLDQAWDEIVVDYERMTKGKGEPSFPDVFGYLILRPWQWSAFWRDAKRTLHAAACLRAYFRAYFEQQTLYA
jgi:adenosylhomocysteine nucleosidase